MEGAIIGTLEALSAVGVLGALGYPGAARPVGLLLLTFLFRDNVNKSSALQALLRGAL